MFVIAELMIWLKRSREWPSVSLCRITSTTVHGRMTKRRQTRSRLSDGRNSDAFCTPRRDTVFLACVQKTTPCCVCAALHGCRAVCGACPAYVMRMMRGRRVVRSHSVARFNRPEYDANASRSGEHRCVSCVVCNAWEVLSRMCRVSASIRSERKGHKWCVLCEWRITSWRRICNQHSANEHISLIYRSRPHLRYIPTWRARA